VNREVYAALQPYSFASVFIAKLDLSGGRLSYVNCGHPSPLLLRGDGTGEVKRLGSDMTMIGVTTEPGYMNFSEVIKPGEVVVVVTDGVTEARNRRGEFYGEDGLIAALEGTREISAEGIASELMRRVQRFARGKLRDDAIIAVLRRLPVSEATE